MTARTPQRQREPSPGPTGSRGAREAIQAWYAGSTAEEFVTRLKAIDFVNTITLFGAVFLLSALPLTILLSSLANRRIEDDLVSHLGLDNRAAQIVERLFQASPQHSASATVIAVALALAGTMGLAGSVQRLYEQIFRRGHGRGNSVRLLIWLAAMCGWLAVDGVASVATRGMAGGTVLDGLIVFSATAAFYGWSMHWLLTGMAWRDVVVPGVVTALFWIGLDAFAAFYFSSTITSDSRLYGNVGVVFSLLTWFIAIAAVVCMGALTGDVVQQRVSARRGRPREST